MTKKGGINTYGAHPEGSIGPWEDLAEYVQQAGGVVWLDSKVTAVGVGADHAADSVTVERAGLAPITIKARSIISNVGPVATGGLALASVWPASYSESLQQQNYPKP